MPCPNTRLQRQVSLRDRHCTSFLVVEHNRGGFSRRLALHLIMNQQYKIQYRRPITTSSKLSGVQGPRLLLAQPKTHSRYIKLAGYR